MKGRTKVEVARFIQSFKGEVTVNYNKLHANTADGKGIDISMRNQYQNEKW